MQMYWTTSFKSRMLFNAGKAYIKQIDKGHQYSELMPVYGISLVNDNFLPEKEYEDIYYHHYSLIHNEIHDEIIEGLEFIFIELPKFKAKTFTEKKIRTLWLRFLTEINENTEKIPEELLSEEVIKDALEYLHVSAFTKEQLAYYDKYWDKIRVERTAIQDALKREQAALKREQVAIKQKEEAQKREQEVQKQKEEAQKQKEEAQNKLRKAIKMMFKRGFSILDIAKDFEISENEVKTIINTKD
jgi:hypothetical protein